MATALLGFAPTPPALGQGVLGLFPHRSLLPSILAGPRDPRSSASLLGVVHNPDAYGAGVEAEVSIGMGLPVFAREMGSPSDTMVVGIEGVAYARFGLQVLERELLATDWVFTVPVVWRRQGGWVRFRYYHTSSHIGDEYSRRFEDRGENFSRDAADLFSLLSLTPAMDIYGGIRFGYNVKPEESKRWVLRGGAQLQSTSSDHPLIPFAAADLEWDQDAGSTPRLDVKVGFWLPPAGGSRTVRLALGMLTGPSPLGQFQGRSTTQISLGLFGEV